MNIKSRGKHDNSHPTIRTRQFAHDNSLPTIRTRQFAPDNSHPTIRSRQFAPDNSLPTIRTRQFAPNNSLPTSQKQKKLKKLITYCYAPEKIPETPVFLESGCDSPEEVAEPPVLHLPSPGPSIMPVGQVRQFLWHYSDKHGLSDVRQKLGKNNKQINSSSLFPPSQTPLVSKVRLL